MPLGSRSLAVSEVARIRALWLAVCLGAALVPSARAGAPATAYARLDIRQVGFGAVEALRHDPAVAWWVELDDVLLVGGDAAELAVLVARSGGTVLAATPGTELRFVGGVPSARLAEWGVRPIAAGGRWVVAELSEAVESALATPSVDGRAIVRPFVPNVVLARDLANAPPRERLRYPFTVPPPVDEVNAARWFADVTTLASWNRYTHGTGIASARDWLVQQFQALPGAAVTTQPFSVGSTTAQNVVARFEGTTTPDDWFIVGGHYDSTSQSPSTAAPGAEDNASGCAGVLEMARIFAAHPPGPTLLFLCYAGEEQGLYGSAAHAAALVASGDDAKVRAVLDMDMIGYSGDADLDCLLETDSDHAFLIDAYTDAAAAYTSLRLVTSLSPAGSDHVPYLNRGMAALLTIENDWDSYAHYHRTTDTPDKILPSLAMGEQILRMNVATLVALASADCTDLDGDGYGNPASVACPNPSADCNDANPAVNPGATEVRGNGIDDDCDGQIDESTGCGGAIASRSGQASAGDACVLALALATLAAARRRVPRVPKRSLSIRHS